MLPQRTSEAVWRASCAWDPRVQAGHVPEESKSPTPSPRPHVLQASAILNLCVCYVIASADPECAAPAVYVDGIGLKHGPKHTGALTA